MNDHEPAQQKVTLYPHFFKLFGCCQIFVSQPFRYIAVSLLFHLNMAIYFTVTFRQGSIVQKIITIVCYILTTIIMLYFTVVDPGIIPKINPEKKEDQIPLKRLQVIRSRQTGICKKIELSMTIKTHYLGIKYCGNCAIYRPPRTIHCYTCGVCIQKLDHHCPWLGMCIGNRNYKYYLVYILLMQVISVLTSVQAILFIVYMPFDEHKVEHIFNIILLAFSALASIFVFTLVVIHFKLSKDNMTTSELHHHKWESSSGNPFQKGNFIGNWLDIFSKNNQSKYYLQEKLQKIPPDEKGLSQSNNALNPNLQQGTYSHSPTIDMAKGINPQNIRIIIDNSPAVSSQRL